MTQLKTVSRRRILAASTAAAVGLAACKDTSTKSVHNPNSISAKRKLTMTCTWPKGSSGLWSNASYISDKVQELTNGSLELELFAAGELVPAFEAFDAVADGSIDCYHGAEAYWTSKSKAFPFFTTVPGGMTSVELTAWINHGGGQELWDQISGKFNIKPFLAGNTGHQMGGWFTKKIKSLDDFKGLKIRIPGLGADLVRELGASPASISGTEVFTALQTGVIDATEWVGPWADMSMGFQQVAPYYYGPGFHEPGAGLSFGMNLDVWNSLSNMHKLILQTIFSDVSQKSVAEYHHFNSMRLLELQKSKTEVLGFPEDVITKAHEVSKMVRENVGLQGEIESKIVNSYEKALMLYKSWSELGDGGFIESRSK